MTDDADTLSACIDAIYHDLEGWEAVEVYHERHMTPSLNVLTVTDDARVGEIMARIRGRIYRRVVVEIGAGVGPLALAMAAEATAVFAIESDPAWSWAFTKHLYATKPANLTWIFGTAESVAAWLRADVAVIVTHSGHAGMQAVARSMAPEVIDVYGDSDSERTAAMSRAEFRETMGEVLGVLNSALDDATRALEGGA